MATTYTWSFGPLEAAPTEGDLTDVVKLIHWRLSGETDDESPVTGTTYGSITTGDADAGSFTAFASLTEEIVKGWTLSNLVEGEETTTEAEARLKASIDAQIDAQKNPARVNKIAPWA